MYSNKRISTEGGRKGIALLVTAAMSVVIFPMVGLSVDVGIMYVVKTKISAATDAAVIAGARTLNRGIDFNAQKDNAIITAGNYFRANFPDKYMLTNPGSSIVTTVTASGLNSRIVVANATAVVPVYFLRFLTNGPPSVTVKASATATRRDSNVMMVIDRSGSLNPAGGPDACTPMKAAAAGFVDKFAEQTDYVGLVTFASSSYYMDFPIATSFKTSVPSLPGIIGGINCTGGTSSAMGLWNGYTALTQLAQPGALNVIVYFTDGNPTAFTGQFPIKLGSTCPNPLKAQIPGIFGVMTENGTAFGLLNASYTPVTAAAEIAAEGTDPLTSASTIGCSFEHNGVTTVESDIGALPTSGKDYYGNLLTGDESPIDVATKVGIDNAATNAAVDAANRIRGGAVITKVTPGAPVAAIGKSLPNVVIFGIGIGTVDPVFMKRVANAPNVVTDPNPSYNSAQPTGFYKYCLTVDDLKEAFDQVAAEVLRLSK